MASIAGRYASRASNGDLPIASRREAAGVGLLLRDALGVSTTPSLRVLLSARSSLRMGRPPLFPFHMAEAWPSSLFPMLLGRSEDLLAWISRRSMRLYLLRLSVWRAQGNGRGLTLRQIRRNAPFGCVGFGRVSKAVLKAEGSGFSIDPRKDGLPSGWFTSSVVFGQCVISCAARSMPHIAIEEHAFRVA